MSLPTLITFSDFENLVRSKKGTNFVTFTYEGPANLLKGGRKGVPVNPYSDVRKRYQVNGTVGFSYESSVNRQRTREGKEADFTPTDRAWGTKEDSFIVRHVPATGENVGKDMSYLIVKVERVLTTPEYIDENGMVLPKEALDPWLRKPSPAARQGIDREVIYRTYTIANIKNLRINGVVYQLIPDRKPASV